MAIRELMLGALAGLTLLGVSGDAPNWKAMLLPNDGSTIKGTVKVDGVHRSTTDMTPAACGDLKATPAMSRDAMPPMHGASMPAMPGDSMPPMRDSVKP